MKRGLLLKGGVAAGVALALAAQSAVAAQLEEVIVTAQKREQSLQDVPVAVTAVSGEAIQDLGIKRLDDLTTYTPTVTITEGTGDDQIFIRGIGSGVNRGFEQSVGLYVDGLYSGRGRSTKTGFLDLERVEVLKGPQGILFGKNTIAGAINITSKSPGEEAEGYALVNYETETNEQTVEAAYGAPITDNFGARVAVRYSSVDGWIDNTFLNTEMQEQEDMVARLSTVWTPSDTVEVITKLQYANLKIGEKPAELSKCGATLGFVAGIDNCRFDGTSTVYAAEANGKTGSDEFEGGSAGITINWDLGDATVTSVTGYTSHNDDFFLEADYTHEDRLSADRDEKYENFSQEIRIASNGGDQFDYVAGVYYEDNTLEFINNLHLVAFGGISRATTATQDGDSQAVFGQFTWHFSEQFDLTVGGRYSEDNKTTNQGIHFAPLYQLEPVLPIPGYRLTADRTDNDFSPTVIAEWRPTDEHMLYAKYSEGFKAGGFDLQLVSGNRDNLEFEPEEAESIEIGSKSKLFDNAMTLNISLFRNEYTNLQVSTFDGSTTFNVGNAASATSQGMDVDVKWAMTDEFTSSLALSLLDATYDSFPTAQCSFPQQAATPVGTPCVNDLSGKDLQFSPDYSGHFNLTWEREVTSGYLLTVATDVVFSDSFHIANDLDPELQQDSFYKLDLRAQLASLEGGWSVALVGRNLNDEYTFHWGNDVPLAPGSYFKHGDKGRTVAIQARLDF